MCGLVATFSSSKPDYRKFELMLGDISHRGPDSHGSVALFNGLLLFGHTRLKIIDVSNHANQPFISPCGRYTLIFNGEIYNYKEIRDLIGGRWQWRTQSDTEVLLASWLVWGVEGLNKFVGMFAFSIYDDILKRVTFVRDRFGIKPLYYVRGEKGWTFSSEIRPLLRVLSSIKPNLPIIRTYLELGLYDHCEYTFFENVISLEAGCLISIDLNSNDWEKLRWYQFDSRIHDLSSATYTEVYRKAESLITDAINLHLVADVNVGLNVSGGVDSSMLVCVSEEKVKDLHLFTQDFDGYSELPWVKEIAGRNTLHVSKMNATDVFAWLLPTVRSQCEPFGGVSVCAYNPLYIMAKESGVTVLLDGNGVDETFLGYSRYHQIYVESSPTETIREKRVDDYKTFWGKPPSTVTVGASIDGTSGLRPNAISKALREVETCKYKNTLKFDDPVKQAAADDLFFSKIPRGLRFNDRVSMYHSRELRVPFLDHRLVEFAFGIPTEYLLTSRGSKTLFRDILSKIASDSVAYAPKRSVQSPQREWLANDWKPFVESILFSESLRERDWIDTTRAKGAYEAFINGDNENSFFIWQWLNLEMWAREFLD